MEYQSIVHHQETSQEIIGSLFDHLPHDIRSLNNNPCAAVLIQDDSTANIDQPLSTFPDAGVTRKHQKSFVSPRYCARHFLAIFSVLQVVDEVWTTTRGREESDGNRYYLTEGCISKCVTRNPNIAIVPSEFDKHRYRFSRCGMVAQFLC